MWHGIPVSSVIAAATQDSTLALWRRSRGANQSTRQVSAPDLASSRSMAPPEPHGRVPRPSH
eukprot:6127814-Alexandrium_andersonii.AAC.1